MIDIATGLSIDPPTACSARNATSHSTVGARLHSSEATVNTPRPAASTRLRPSRSAVEPASINRLASTTVYASTVHCSPETPACRSPAERRERDVDGGDVEADDEQAHAADEQDSYLPGHNSYKSI